MARQKLRILGVNAHPHDFTHYSGTLGLHTALGDEVTVVSVTSGVQTHNEALADELRKPEAERDMKIVDQPAEEYAAIKYKELVDACALFGITDVRDLGFPQPYSVAKYPESVDALRDIIYEVRPHVMITQKPYLDGTHGHFSAANDDHLETAFASLEARGVAGSAVPGSTEAPHTIAATYYPGVYFEKDEFDFIVDIGPDWFEKRVQAEATYISQGHTLESSRQRIGMTTGYIGFFAGVQYAEAFVGEKAPLMPHIVVPESALAKSGESHHESQRRRLGTAAPKE